MEDFLSKSRLVDTNSRSKYPTLHPYSQTPTSRSTEPPGWTHGEPNPHFSPLNKGQHFIWSYQKVSVSAVSYSHSFSLCCHNRLHLRLIVTPWRPHPPWSPRLDTRVSSPLSAEVEMERHLFTVGCYCSDTWFEEDKWFCLVGHTKTHKDRKWGGNRSLRESSNTMGEMNV